MKITLNSQSLPALRFVGAGASNQRIPILGTVRITVDSWCTEFRAADLDVTLTAQVPPELADVDGAACIPAKGLLLAAKVGPFSIDSNCTTAEFTSTAGRSKVNLLPVVDFPLLPAWTPSTTCEVDATSFLAALKQVATALSTDETRYVLNGVFIEIEGDVARLVATDGRRLHVAEVPMPAGGGTEERTGILIPTVAVKHLLRLPAPRDGVLRIEADSVTTGTRCRFSCAGYAVESKQIDGNFPNWRQVIPSGEETKLTVRVNPVAVLKAIAVVKHCISEKANSVKLQFNFDTLDISACTPEVGESSCALPIYCNRTLAKPIALALSPKYLSEAMTACNKQEATLALIDELSPVKATCGRFTAVVMPMRMS